MRTRREWDSSGVREKGRLAATTRLPRPHAGAGRFRVFLGLQQPVLLEQLNRVALPGDEGRLAVTRHGATVTYTVRRSVVPNTS